MKKRFQCDSCYRNCEATFEVLGGKGTYPTMCIDHKGRPCNWEPVEAPELTQDIFETDECPSWAEYAAVDAYGNAYFYSSKPVVSLLNAAWYLPIKSAQAKPYHGGKFDATNWVTSLVKREFKIPELPDWVYNGEYGYHQEYGYIRLGEILELETQVICVDTGETLYVGNDRFFNGRIVEATRRPFDAAEMKQLVGKVLVNTKGARYLITYAAGDGSIIECGYDIAYTAEDLITKGFTIDGKPCYKLEHLNEKGEWVE